MIDSRLSIFCVLISALAVCLKALVLAFALRVEALALVLTLRFWH